MPEKIVKGLWQVGGPGLTASEDAAIYLLLQGAEAAIVDAGSGNAHEILVDNIRAALPADTVIRYLFLTHCHYDHSGSTKSKNSPCSKKRIPMPPGAGLIDVRSQGFSGPADWSDITPLIPAATRTEVTMLSAHSESPRPSQWHLWEQN